MPSPLRKSPPIGMSNEQVRNQVCMKVVGEGSLSSDLSVSSQGREAEGGRTLAHEVRNPERDKHMFSLMRHEIADRA